MRMDTTTFATLVGTVSPRLQRNQDGRPPICPEELVAICLRYLATGDSYKSIAFSYRVGVSTVHYAVKNVCDAIYENLSAVYLPSPTLDTWKNVATRYEQIWNFPHCVGSLDGKHIQIQAPPNSGSLFFNYKGTFSLVLMALVDADYKFIVVDIGNFGSNSDGGIFAKSELGKALEYNGLNLPESEPLANANELGSIPYVIVADEAFPLKTNLMRPYPGRGLDNEKRIFNYRLSRARRMVECAFGILASKWRIFHRRICMLPENVERVVKATVVLHNMLLTHQDEKRTRLLETRTTDTSETLTAIDGQVRRGVNRPKSEAVRVREAFKQYFNSANGAVEWQNNIFTEGL